jgi:Skp family chaperone for outer membrane proteins
MRRLLSAFFITSLTFSLSSIANADVRIATVDLGRVLNETKEAKELKVKLDNMAVTLRKKIQVKQSELKKLEDLFEDGAKKADDSKSLQSIQEKKRDLARLLKDSEDEIKVEFGRVNRVLTEKALAKIRDFSAKNSYDMVLSKSMKERGLVLHGESNLDITDQVIRLIDG